MNDADRARALELIAGHRAQFGRVPAGMDRLQWRDFHDRRRASQTAVAADLVEIARRDGLLLAARHGGHIALTPDIGTTKWRTTRFAEDMTPEGHDVFDTAEAAANDLIVDAKLPDEARAVAPDGAGRLACGAPANEAEYLDPDAIRKAERETYVGGARSLSSREHPQTAKAPPVGSWTLSRMRGAHGREIEQLVELDPNELEISEDTGPEKWADVERYAQWMASGEHGEAPPIDVVQTDAGRLKVSNGHRRTIAARLARTKVLAWVSWAAIAENGAVTGMTFELAKQGARALEIVPPRPEFQIFEDDKRRLQASRAKMSIGAAGGPGTEHPECSATEVAASRRAVAMRDAMGRAPVATPARRCAQKVGSR